MLIAILFLAIWMPGMHAFRCGDRGQCFCMDSAIFCPSVEVAPTFDETLKASREITLQVTESFDWGSMWRVAGFAKVTVEGEAEECRTALAVYTWMECSRGSVATTEEAPGDLTTAEAGGGEEEKRTDQAGWTLTYTNEATTGLIIWAAVSGGLFVFAVCCLCVSGVTFHGRINALAGNNEQPRFAVKICLHLMALSLLPLHLVARVTGRPCWGLNDYS